jgi:hypothetical protein
MLDGVYINLSEAGGNIMPRLEYPVVIGIDAENCIFVNKYKVAVLG